MFRLQLYGAFKWRRLAGKTMQSPFGGSFPLKPIFITRRAFVSIASMPQKMSGPKEECTGFSLRVQASCLNAYVHSPKHRRVLQRSSYVCECFIQWWRHIHFRRHVPVTWHWRADPVWAVRRDVTTASVNRQVKQTKVQIHVILDLNKKLIKRWDTRTWHISIYSYTPLAFNAHDGAVLLGRYP